MPFLHISPEEVGTASFALEREQHYRRQRQAFAKAQADAAYERGQAHVAELVRRAEHNRQERVELKKINAIKRAEEARERQRLEEQERRAEAKRQKIEALDRVEQKKASGSITINMIVDAVSAVRGVSVDLILKSPRLYALERQIAAYLARKHTNKSLTQIGRAIGRDHTTCVFGCKTITRKIADDEELRQTVEQIEAVLS